MVLESARMTAKEAKAKMLCYVICKLCSNSKDTTHLVTIAGWVTKTWVLGFGSAAVEKWGFNWQFEQNFSSSFA